MQQSPPSGSANNTRQDVNNVTLQSPAVVSSPDAGSNVVLRVPDVSPPVVMTTETASLGHKSTLVSDLLATRKQLEKTTETRSLFPRKDRE